MADKQLESVDDLRKQNKKWADFKSGEQVMLFIPAIPKGMSKQIAVRWHGSYNVAGLEEDLEDNGKLRCTQKMENEYVRYTRAD